MIVVLSHSHAAAKFGLLAFLINKKPTWVIAYSLKENLARHQIQIGSEIF